MRTIKFRGKDIKTGEWLYVDLRNKQSVRGAFIATLHCCNVKINPITIGQFTGLTDKNGNEIYEGDILAFVEDKNKSFPFVVLFKHGAFGYTYIRGAFYSFAGNPNFTFNPLNTDIDIEIIGNIHDNIELLTKKVI